MHRVVEITKYMKIQFERRVILAKKQFNPKKMKKMCPETSIYWNLYLQIELLRF